ncbi:uncharacterized protein LOC143475271 isoform X2 [Brachyhypopomus gauderio]
MEEGALQKERTLRHDTQQALEVLAQRRAQLHEHIDAIHEQRKQEGQMLLSLREEQEDLEQTAQEYEKELERATEDLQRLREEIGLARTRVEEAHERMGPLKHAIGDTYTEISEAKQRLGELITEMTAIEACVPEVTCRQVDEPLNVALDGSSREEEEDKEVYCGRVYEEDNALTQNPAEKEPSKREVNEEGPEKLERSLENLKSSGSSSFTEITLTEVKEDASPRSTTPQHMDSADLEDEDFEIVHSLVAKPVSQAASREFDFFHPDPFVDHDVFGDDRFPKVDVTEFLSGDPFKGTDPFASDVLFDDVADIQFAQDYPFTQDSIPKESNQTSSGLGSTNRDPSAVTAPNSGGPNCSQSVDSGMFEQNLAEPGDSERYTPYSDICSEPGANTTRSQDLDSMDLKNTLGTECVLSTRSQLKGGGRFDPIHCELDLQESGSSNTSTVDSSFDGDFGTFIGMEHPDGQSEAEAGPTYVRASQALCGLRRIDTSSYTHFPLSPEGYDPEPEDLDTAEKDKSVHAVDSCPFISDRSATSESKPKTEDSEHVSPQTDSVTPGNPSPLSHELPDVHSDSTDNRQTNKVGHSPEPTETDIYDHKFGDIYFFTVRLDPGSPDSSPVSAEASDRRQSESDHVSPEPNDTDEFNCGGPEDENNIQSSRDACAEEGLNKDELEIGTEQPFSSELEEKVHSEFEVRNLESLYSEQQSAGLDFLEHSMYNSECDDAFSLRQENMENVDPFCSPDTNSESSNTEPIIQYLISPVKLCGNTSSLESSFIDHCNSLGDNPEPLEPEKNTIKKIDLCDAKVRGLDLFDCDSFDTTTCEVKQPNSVYSVSTDSGRLDSGYHENSGPDLLSLAHTDQLPFSGDIGPGPESNHSNILSPENVDQPILDPFSPECSDTLMFDSELEICNPTTNDGVKKDSCHLYMASSDMLGDSFSGSEIDSFDPFSPVPQSTGGHNVDILVPGSVQNYSKSVRETRSSSWDSGVSSSPQVHCGSALTRGDTHPLPEDSLADLEAQNYSYLSNCSTKSSLLKSGSTNMSDVSSCKSKVENVAEQGKNAVVNVTAMADLAEIDFFCSELSKMVASRSSDTVQQSVAEMLFGSNPDTAKFYPWDLENSNNVVNERSKTEIHFGHALDDAEKPSLL